MNLKPGLFGSLLCQIFQAFQIRIDDLFASRADQMGVRVRLVAVIAVASIREANLYDFIFLLKQSPFFFQGFIDFGIGLKNKKTEALYR